MYSFEEVEKFDSEVAKAIENETGRQRENIELIASENLVSKAVMAAMGSTLTNKYAEGYPGKRYYGGCEHVDVVENLAPDGHNCRYEVAKAKRHVFAHRQQQ